MLEEFFDQFLQEVHVCGFFSLAFLKLPDNVSFPIDDHNIRYTETWLLRSDSKVTHRDRVASQEHRIGETLFLHKGSNNFRLLPVMRNPNPC